MNYSANDGVLSLDYARLDWLLTKRPAPYSALSWVKATHPSHIGRHRAASGGIDPQTDELLCEYDDLK
jgi:hypothetical protein